MKRAVSFAFFLLIFGLSSTANAIVNLNFTDVTSLTDDAAENLLETVALGADHRPYAPASPLGLKLGLDVMVDVTVITIPQDFKDALALIGNTANVPDSVPLPRLNIRKGLPWGIDIGFSYIALDDNKIAGGDIQWAFLDMKGLPKVAVRAARTVSRLWFLSTRNTSIDFIGSYPLGPVFEPYLGLGWQFASGDLNVPVANLPANVSANQTFSSPRIFVGFPFDLLFLKFVPEFNYSFKGRNDLRNEGRSFDLGRIEQMVLVRFWTRRLLQVLLLSCVFAIWAGCNSISSLLQSFAKKVQKTEELEGEESVDPALTAARARKAKSNAELLGEMHRVVFMRKPEEKGEFGSFVDTLNQGASLEGVYNGFTHSSHFRRLEVSNPGATPKALKFFGRELVRLGLEMKSIPRFQQSDAQPLALPVQPSVAPGEDAKEGVTVMEFDGDAPKETARPSLDALAERYSNQFVGASIFTLKRILGDQALLLIEEKNEYREKFALWYSAWVVELSRYEVDFGLGLRNKPDKDFHYAWAVKAKLDRLIWEVLNRLHRLMNDANKR